MPIAHMCVNELLKNNQQGIAHFAKQAFLENLLQQIKVGDNPIHGLRAIANLCRGGTNITRQMLFEKFM